MGPRVTVDEYGQFCLPGDSISWLSSPAAFLDVLVTVVCFGTEEAIMSHDCVLL